MTLKDENFYPKVKCELFGDICKEFYHMTRFSPKGTLLVTTSENRDVTVWNTESGAVVCHLETPHKKKTSRLWQ